MQPFECLKDWSYMCVSYICKSHQDITYTNFPMNFNYSLLIVVTLSLAITICRAQSLDERVIHGYSFEGHTNSSTSVDGAANGVGTIFTTDRFGIESAAIEINNKSDGIDIPTIDDDTVSVSMWYYYKESGSFWNTLLYSPLSYHHLLIAYQDDNDGEIGYWESGVGFFSSAVTLKENRWHHIALVMAGPSYTLYLNGDKIMETDEFFQNADHPMTFLGNFDIDGGSQGSLGALDDVCFIKGELTQTEVDALYETRKECDPAPNNLLLNLGFNGNLNDESGQANHATLSGASMTTDRNGLENSAVLIDDKTDAITLTSAISAEDLTISCWFRYDGTSDDLSTLFGGPNDQRHMTIQFEAGTAGDVGAYNNGFISSDTSLLVGEWHHLFAQMDGSAQTTSFFVDGRRMESLFISSFDNASSPLSVIGNNSSTGSEGALGAIDDIKIYNKILTLEEMKTVLCGGVINHINDISHASKNRIDLAPNPTSGLMRLTGKHEHVQILDVSGQFISTVTIDPQTDFTIIEASSLTDGIYFIVTENGHGKFVKH